MRTPYDKAAEIATLSAALQSPSARKEAKKFISGEDFYSPAHETLWDVMATMDRERIPVEAAMLQLQVGTADQQIRDALVEVITANVVPDNVGHYAGVVRAWAVRRRVHQEALWAQQAAEDPEVDASGLAAAFAAKLAAVRDSGAEDVKSITLDELLATDDDEPDWVIPGLLEEGATSAAHRVTVMPSSCDNDADQRDDQAEQHLLAGAEQFHANVGGQRLQGSSGVGDGLDLTRHVGA